MSTLGAPSALGDVDVLATKSSYILVVECKHLLPARTVGEVADQLKRFRGEADDELNRHLRRYEWLRVNPSAIRAVFRLIGAECENATFVPLLVTNAVVPMQFKQGLPLAAENVTPIGSLSEALKGLCARRK